MAKPVVEPRRAEAPVDELFIERWSPRAFRDEPLSETEVAGLFEAARWAPSCYNDQPWLFLYARAPEDRARFLQILTEGNRVWASRAPLLAFVLARRAFRHNGRVNRHALFDAGAAWMSLALQARRLGLYAHGMAGFSPEKVYADLGVPEAEYDAIAAVAVGRLGDPGTLPENLAAMEHPNQRKPPVEVAREGAFAGA